MLEDRFLEALKQDGGGSNKAVVIKIRHSRLYRCRKDGVMAVLKQEGTVCENVVLKML